MPIILGLFPDSTVDNLIAKDCDTKKESD
jgi:hypothetical protein